jgi:hypothetical protein
VRVLCADISRAPQGGDVERSIRREVMRALGRLGVSDDALSRVCAITAEAVNDWMFYGGAGESGRQRIRENIEGAFGLLAKGMEDGVTYTAVETARALRRELGLRRNTLSRMASEAADDEDAALTAYSDAEADYQSGGSPDSFYAAAEAEQRRAAAGARAETVRIAAEMIDLADAALGERLPDLERTLERFGSLSADAERIPGRSAGTWRGWWRAG